MMMMMMIIITIFSNDITVNYKQSFKYKKRKVINEIFKGRLQEREFIPGVQTHPWSFRPLRISGLEERTPQKEC